MNPNDDPQNLSRPEWQLPRGVTRGVWEYTQAQHIAGEYDAYFAENQLFEFDEQVLLRHFRKQGTVFDFGCGTGRALVPLARRGFAGVGVDLSPHMLQIVAEKAKKEHLKISCLQANLVDLSGIKDRSADYEICLFSTLGMIRGREKRQKALEEFYRVLKPGGLFVIHVHNVWFNLFDPLGRRWLAKHFVERLKNREIELGDKFFCFHGIAQMFLHTFTHGELHTALRSAGFRIRESIPLNVDRQRPLAQPWLLSRFRANGWIVICEK